jgi:hypothetical protein
MQYIGYNWDLSSDMMIPDEEINTKVLGWKAGDYWQVQEHNGKKIFVKVDPIVKFMLEGCHDKV